MRNGSLLLSHDAWFVRLYVGGKQRAYRLGPKRQFMTKKEVRAAADRKMLELRMVDAGSAGRITLETFVRLWYLKLQAERLRPSTVDEYEGMFNRYIAGRNEAKRPLTEYKTHHVQALLGGIATDNELSRETLKHIKAFLSGVFRHAVAAGLREGNPVRDTLLPKSNKPTVTPGVYTLAQIDTILAALAGHPALRAAVAVGAYAGLRRSEIAGLHWSDYDAKEHTLTVQRTRWRNAINPPKSAASASWVPVIPKLAAILAEYQAKPGKRRYSVPRSENAVYDADAMFKVGLYDIGRSTIKPLITKHQVPWLGWHALRRGLASNLFELGCDDLTVMRILRHASVTVTRAHYIRVRDPKVEDAMARLNAALEIRQNE